MSYLFGDLTPFPHDANFIELIRDAAEMCRALLQAEATINRLRDRMEVERAAATRNIEDLRRVVGDVAEALRPHLTARPGPVQEVSSRLAQAMRGVVESAQSSLQSRRDSELGQLEAKVVAERGQVLPALEKFLTRHELPHTVWRVTWTGAVVESQVADIKAWATAPFGLDASFEVSLPANSPWLRTIRIGDIKPKMVLELQKRARHGTVPKRHELDRYFITEASITHNMTRLTMRKTPKPSTPGLELTWDGDELSITPLDDDSLAPGPQAPDPRYRLVVAGLRSALEGHLRSFLTWRTRVTEARLGQSDVLKLDTPATLARVVLKSIAPICREIIVRSSVPGELSLKRVVDDGRREEIFIKASDLTKIYSSLPPEQWSYFDELGFPSITTAPAPAPAPPRPSIPTGPMMPVERHDDPAPDRDRRLALEMEAVTGRHSALDEHDEVIIHAPPFPEPDDDDRHA